MRNHCNSCGDPECKTGERIAELETENAERRDITNSLIETNERLIKASNELQAENAALVEELKLAKSIIDNGANTIEQLVYVFDTRGEQESNDE